MTNDDLAGVTVFFGLYQGDFSDHEGDATCFAVFSEEKKAEAFKDLLSAQHTELKRQANEAKQQARREHPRFVPVPYVPDLYWDIRPVVFDPRTIEELGAAE